MLRRRHLDEARGAEVCWIEGSATRVKSLVTRTVPLTLVLTEGLVEVWLAVERVGKTLSWITGS